VDLAAYIRDIPDWPQEGVVFKDITPLLASPEGLKQTIDTLAEAYADAGRFADADATFSDALAVVERADANWARDIRARRNAVRARGSENRR